MNRLGIRSVCVLALLVLPCSLEAAVFWETFNDNVLNTSLWSSSHSGGVRARERNSRLEFTANGATGNASFAQLMERAWRIDWYDFTLSFDYKFDLPALSGSQRARMSVMLAPGTQDFQLVPLVIGVERTRNGLYLFWSRGYTDFSSTVIHRKLITQTSGTVTIRWSKATDFMTVTGGGQSFGISGFHAASASYPLPGGMPLVMTLMCETYGQNISFTGSKAHIDNLYFSGRTQGF